MKAKIKATGEIIEVMPYATNGVLTLSYKDAKSGYIYNSYDVTIISNLFDDYDHPIDWEQRQWDATVAAMQGLLAYGCNPDDAVNYAKDLIKQYKGE